MARLEDLIGSVADADLQRQLGEEVKILKERTRFGLVFERHIPETVLTAASGRLRVGDQVRLRAEPAAGEALRVTSVNGAMAQVANGEGDEQTVNVSELLIVRQFGDPVFPTLTPLGSVDAGGERPYHAVINGENYHALQLLEYATERQVDCIYIDPPYNTGARDWKYNNDYVDENDRWHHSKWLAMMERRLRVAKRLLKSDGVLICTIDEHEVHHLGGLLEQLFPEYLRYMVNIVINPKGTRKANFGRVEEHAFFVVPDVGYEVIAHLPPPDEEKESPLAVEAEDRSGDKEAVWVRDVSANGALPLPAGLRERLGLEGATIQVEVRLGDDGAAQLRPILDEDEADDESTDTEAAGAADDEVSVLFLRRRGAESSFRHQRPNQFYAIKVKEATREVVGVGPFMEKDDPYELGYREDDVLWVYPIDEDGNERVWRYVRETMQEYIDAGQIRVGKRWKGKPQTYTLNHYKPREGERVQRLRTTWWRTAHDAGTHGTTLLSRLLGTQSQFPFPKSLYAVRDCLEAVVKDRPDALIVDYFAGSGTTLHATALLNQADGGRRRCVLVTNNEVDEETSKRLKERGHLPGDPEFERHGIFEAATRPRIETALTGVRPDGKRVPTGKAYRYLDGRHWADGFEENCDFLQIDYLDPDEVELGRRFNELHTLLWLIAGGRGKRPDGIDQGKPFAIVEASGYGVLFDETALREFIAAANEAEHVEHLFLVTASEDAFAEMSEEIGPNYKTHQLYRDYLVAFRASARYQP